MEIHQITPQTKFTKNDTISIPISHSPLFRSHLAIQMGVEKNILLRTWGGIGDQICAEPTLRFALQIFKGCSVSLASERPELFTHLPFKRVFDLNEELPNYDKYFLFETITPPNDSNMVWQFFSHMLTNCVDFPSLCALRSQLPIEQKELRIPAKYPLLGVERPEKLIVVHAGRHWPSKTFPKAWWDGVLDGLVEAGFTPVLIGANTDDNRGTVDVDSHNCMDLRNKLSLPESIWLCQHADVVLTNDSAPLHMAASRAPGVEPGGPWIGYVATCKHPDYITHWRRNLEGKLEWQWRQENLGLGGMWDIVPQNPGAGENITVDQVDPDVLAAWLPNPKEVVAWTKSKIF